MSAPHTFENGFYHNCSVSNAFNIKAGTAKYQRRVVYGCHCGLSAILLKDSRQAGMTHHKERDLRRTTLACQNLFNLFTKHNWICRCFIETIACAESNDLRYFIGKKICGKYDSRDILQVLSRTH